MPSVFVLQFQPDLLYQPVVSVKPSLQRGAHVRVRAGTEISPAPPMCQALSQVCHTPRLHLNFMTPHRIAVLTQLLPMRTQQLLLKDRPRSGKEARPKPWSVSNTHHFSTTPGLTPAVALMNVSHVK